MTFATAIPADSLITPHAAQAVHIALTRQPAANGQCQVLVSTVVRTHNWLGRLYMLPVAPFHRLIAPIALRRLRA